MSFRQAAKDAWQWAQQTPIVKYMRSAWSGCRTWLRKDWSPGAHGFFGPSFREHVAIFACALLIAIGVYSSSIGWTYRNVYQAYHRVFIGQEVLGANPFVERHYPDSGGGDYQLAHRDNPDLVLLACLRVMGLMSNEDDANSLKSDSQPWAKQLSQMLSADVQLTTVPAPEVLVHIAQRTKPATEIANETAAELRQKLGVTVAAIMAAQPGAFEKLRDAVQGASEEAPVNGDILEAINANFGEKYGRGPIDFVWQGLRWRPAAPHPDAEVRNVLYTLTGLTRIDPTDPNASMSSGLKQDDYDQIDTFQGELMSRLHASPDVKAARFWTTLYLGPEQFFLWLAFFWMLLLLLNRALDRRRCSRLVSTTLGRIREDLTKLQQSERLDHIRDRRRILDESLGEGVRDPLLRRVGMVCQRSLALRKETVSAFELRELIRGLKSGEIGGRWPIAWLAMSIPAIGFVGTVRGISAALSNSDSIVRAQTTVAQAAAITEVSAMLGIAFTTTLIALVMGLITSACNKRQSREESALFDRLESGLSPLLQPIVADPVPLPEPPAVPAT